MLFVTLGALEDGGGVNLRAAWVRDCPPAKSGPPRSVLKDGPDALCRTDSAAEAGLNSSFGRGKEESA